MKAPEFWRKDKGGLYAALMTPLAWVYGAAAWARFAAGRPWKAAIPVICVGNIVAGGAGKTPVTISIGKRLAAKGKGAGKGKTVHFLTRGYGGGAGHDKGEGATGPLRVDPEKHTARDVGDEALLLARVAPTWVAVDRAAGARSAIKAGAEVIVMDDGFQNPSLVQDLSLIVVDGDYGFGNGRLIPAGPLREPVARGLRRAGAVMVIGADRAGVTEAAQKMGKAVLRLELVAENGAAFSGQRVAAFAGIGRPEKFFATLESIGCQVASRHPFADHHVFSADEIKRLREQAGKAGSRLVTTEKDFARLDESLRQGISVLKVSARWADEAALAMVLARAFDESGKNG